MAQNIEVRRTRCTCDVCDKKKSNCFEFSVKDEEGKLIRRVKHCFDCLESLFVRVVSLLPLAFILPLVAKGHLLIRM